MPGKTRIHHALVGVRLVFPEVTEIQQNRMNKSVFHAAVAAFVDMWAAQVNFLQLIFPNVPESIITAQTSPDTIPPTPTSVLIVRFSYSSLHTSKRSRLRPFFLPQLPFFFLL